MLNQALRAAVEAELTTGESVVAWFAPDIDHRFRYAEGLVVLTDRRLLSDVEHDENPTPSDGKASRFWRSWPLEAVTSLEASDRAGLGTLEIFGTEGRLGYWRYTVDRAPQARQLVDHLDALRRGERVDDEGLDEPSDDAEEVVPAPPGNSRALLKLWRFAQARSGLLTLGFFLSLAATAVGLIPPYLSMPLLDDVLIPFQNRVEAVRAQAPADAAARAQQDAELRALGEQRMNLVGWYLVGLAVAAVAAWLLTWAQGVVMAWVSERITADLRNQTYSHLQTLSLEYFGGKRTGDLISRISTDTERLCSFLSDNLVDFGADVLMIVGTSAILIAIDPLLAVATLLPFPLIGWLILQLRGRLTHGFRRGGRAWAAMTSVLADTIPGIRVVKAFAQEHREIDRFAKANDLVVRANDRVNTVWTFFWPMVALLNQIGLLAVWAFGAWRVFDLNITVGVLTAFLTYIGRFYTRLESMSRMFTATQRAAAGAQRIFEILDRTASVPEPLDPVHPGRLRGEVEFRNVGFRYGNRTVVEGLTFTIRPGEMIGLVGPSGAGKSTLVNLACRFYDVGEGAVVVDGVDIRKFPVAEYRRNVGLVLQEPFLFFGTVAENIAYGRPDASRDEIVAAAKAARAHDFILRLPLGYDSLVGERGQSLSGGERQRISIARALLIDPRILILDEATSSVDTETEREIQAALDNLIKGRTTIAIAHRLSTLRKADRLIVLERGRIAEVGRHDDLLKVDGVYTRLHKAQMELTHGVE